MTVAIVRQQNIYRRFAYSLVKRGVHFTRCVFIVTIVQSCKSYIVSF